MDSFSRWSSRLSGGLLVVLILCMALPLGSNRDWSWSPLAAAVACIAIVQSGSLLSPRGRSAISYVWLLPAALALALAIAWAFLQVAAPGFLVSPNPVVDQALATLGRDAQPRVALRTDAVLTEVMLWVAYALAFWSATDLARDMKQGRRLLVAIVVSGVAITVYALALETAERLKSDLAMLIPRLGFGSGFSGTFVNRNNYATYIGLCALCAIALMQMDLPPPSRYGEPLRLRVRRILLQLGGRVGVTAAAFVLLLSGVVLSASRAGMFSFLAGLLTTWLLGRRRSLVGLVVGVIMIGLFLALPGGQELIGKSIDLINDQGGGERARLYVVDVQAIGLRPWSGWGMGTFTGVFSLLQPLGLSGDFDKAHNTYLELAMELGIPLTVLLLAGVLVIVIRCAIGVGQRSRNREVPGLALAATVLVGVHSIFDFSLQIPAVAVLFAVILGIGWAQSWNTRRTEEAAKA